MKIDIAEAKDIDARDIVMRSPVAGNPRSLLILQRFLLRSIQSYIGRVDGNTACIWGLVAPSLLSDEAYLWLLTTDLVEKHEFLFVRHSQIAVRKMLADFPLIVGHTDPSATRSIRWLKWLGARFLEQEQGLIRFEIRRA